MFPYTANDVLRAMREKHGWDDPYHPANNPPTDEEVDAMLRWRAGSSRPVKTRLAFLGLVLAVAFVALATGASVVS